jgi:hypothetical protein
MSSTDPLSSWRVRTPHERAEQKLTHRDRAGAAPGRRSSDNWQTCRCTSRGSVPEPPPGALPRTSDSAGCAPPFSNGGGGAQPASFWVADHTATVGRTAGTLVVERVFYVVNPNRVIAKSAASEGLPAGCLPAFLRRQRISVSGGASHEHQREVPCRPAEARAPKLLPGRCRHRWLAATRGRPYPRQS